MVGNKKRRCSALCQVGGRRRETTQLRRETYEALARWLRSCDKAPVLGVSEVDGEGRPGLAMSMGRGSGDGNGGDEAGKGMPKKEFAMQSDAGKRQETDCEAEKDEDTARRRILNPEEDERDGKQVNRYS